MSDKIENMIASLNAEVTNAINKTNEEVQNSSKLGRENKEVIASLESKIVDVTSQVEEMAQNQVNLGSANEAVKSVGQAFAESETFQNMRNGQSQKARFEVQNNTVVGSDAIVAPDRQMGIVSGPNRILRVADVMPVGTTTSNAIEYTREDVFTSNAAETAEAALKPESDITFTLESVPVATIAHWIKISKQVMADAPALASYIDSRMRYGVELREDKQLLNGDGLGSNISGLLKTGNHTVYTPSVGDSPIESIRKAITLVEQADYAPTAVMMNPADCQAIDLEKAAVDGHFLASANPRSAQTKEIWGLPIVVTNTIPAGTFALGAWNMATQVWRRQGTVVDLSEYDGDNMQKNLVTLRAEKRLALATYRPASIYAGALTA